MTPVSGRTTRRVLSMFLSRIWVSEEGGCTVRVFSVRSSFRGPPSSVFVTNVSYGSVTRPQIIPGKSNGVSVWVPTDARVLHCERCTYLCTSTCNVVVSKCFVERNRSFDIDPSRAGVPEDGVCSTSVVLGGVLSGVPDLRGLVLLVGSETTLCR